MTDVPTRTPEQRQAQVHQLADLLDSRFRIPFTRQTFGVDAILGVVPGIGDVAGLVASSLVIAQAVRLGARGWTLASMLLNVAVDALVGVVPLAGTVFDVVYKANRRNVDLLERHATAPARARTDARRSVVRSLLVIVGVVLLVSMVVVAAIVWLVGLVTG